jgi:hypothetical protein
MRQKSNANCGPLEFPAENHSAGTVHLRPIFQAWNLPMVVRKADISI